MSIVAYAPDDLTVTVTADTMLEVLQQHLAPRNQWLPVDPPDPARLSIGEIVDCDLSGPRRYGYGTIREYVLSLRAELADGRMIKTGASVVKNAAMPAMESAACSSNSRRVVAAMMLLPKLIGTLM